MKALIVLALTLTLAAPTLAQNQRPSSGKDRLRAFQAQQRLTAASPFGKLPWRLIGPDTVSGRCTEVAAVPGNDKLFYAAFATGGLWKTEDGGTSWVSLFDNQPTLSIGAIALAPSNPNIVYVGTGESNIFRASLPGVGAFRSDDGGKTWKHLGLENTGTIARIIVHPADPNRVWLAAGGNEWSYNRDRGLYYSENGGKSWKKLLGDDDKIGVIDLVMDPSNPETLYVSTWNRIRRRWSDPVPEDGDYLYKSTDGGKSFRKIGAGLPETKVTGRIGLAVARSNPKVVYAFVDNHTPTRAPRPGEMDGYGRPRELVFQGAEVWRSDDAGEHFQRVSENLREGFAGTYGWVFGQVRVAPNDENTVYLLGVSLQVSTDGGKTFGSLSRRPMIHGDNHALWIDPTNPNVLLNGNDGGVNRSTDGGETWTTYYRLIPTQQFYNIAYDMAQPFSIYGSMQDQGSMTAPITITYGKPSEPGKGWRGAPGGEGTLHAIDPTNPNLVYASSFYGSLQRTDLSLPPMSRAKRVAPVRGEGEEYLRGEWLAATILSPHDPKTLYHGFQYVFKSTDQGEHWTRISTDLTYNDKEKMGHTPYAVNHQTITALAESPKERGVLYAGTDDGRVHLTRDDGKTWTELTAGLPKNTHVSRIVASKWTAGTVYLTLSDRREDNITPYVFQSTDYGKTWKKIVGNLPPHPVNVIQEDPKRVGTLYVGTDLGLYVSRDGGKRWDSILGGFPSATVSVQDLFVHPRDNVLVMATYGRGVWALDDPSIFQK